MADGAITSVATANKPAAKVFDANMNPPRADRRERMLADAARSAMFSLSMG
jgi:hypothetical protein